MLDLSNTTLWACVWTPSEAWIDRTFRVVRYCTSLADFGDVVFFCCVDPKIKKECNWRIVRVPEMDMSRWNLFVNREVPKHIRTDFAMAVHEDGFIINPGLWKPEFVGYDYIGAPWPDGTVGNQGFSIESRKMLQTKLSIPPSSDDDGTPSDNFLCVKHRDWLQKRGIRFAPQAVAERFSTEMYGDEKPSFGFHGRNHSHRKYKDGWDKIAQFENPRFAVLTGHLPNYAELAKHTIYQNKAEYCQRHGYKLLVHTGIRSRYEDLHSHAWGFSWSRLEHMAELVASGEYDWVWVVGCDTLITNMTTRLDSLTCIADCPSVRKEPMPTCPDFPGTTAPNPVIRWTPTGLHLRTGRKHLIATGERATAIQADSFMVRGSEEGYAYLMDILDKYEMYKHHPWVENQAMIDLIEKHASMTLLLPQHMLNAYDYSCFYHIDNRYREGRDCYGNRGQWQPGDFLIHWPGVSLQKRMQLLKQYTPFIIR